MQLNTNDQAEPLVDDRIFRRCSAYCTAARYEIEDLLRYLQHQGCEAMFFRVSSVVHRAFPGRGDIFYFSYGTIVMWGLSKEAELEMLAELKRFEDTPIENVESEKYRFTIGHTAKILKDEITMPADNVLTKLAFSHGLSQSVQLSDFEKLIDRRIVQSRDAPISLAKYGRIQMSRKKLSRMMGEIIIDRNIINLHTNILDTPEFFWEYSDLESLYRLISQDLDIASRISVLNKRLDILKDLFEVLSSELERRYSSRLEWIIIALIFIELAVTTGKEVFRIL
jgi:uncharacterized Rmd1/YagE family protein